MNRKPKSLTSQALAFAKFLIPAVAACALFSPVPSRAQTVPPADCNCISSLPELKTNACQAYIPDLCLLATNCFSTNVTVGTPGFCNQTPPAGTIVGPGIHTIMLTVFDNQGLANQCAVQFSVTPVPGCVLTLICTNKTVECGTAWTFDPPTWTNACVPPPGTVSNGVTLTFLGAVTNGSCPEVITATWQGVDDCGYHDQCTQTITVVDTQPPQLDCKCLTNNPVMPVVLTVTACATNIPDLCFPARVCAFDNCGIVSCSQTPAAGTPVGVGVHPITVTVYDCASNSASCVLNFNVVPPPGGCGGPCVPPPSGMVGWWALDETCGAPVFADLSANGNAAIVESAGPVCNGGSPNAVPGVVSGANYFYGHLVRGRAPNAPSLNFGTGSFGLDCWANPVFTGPVHWHPIVDKLLQTGPATGFGYKVGLLNTQVVLVVGDGTLYTYTSVGSVNYAAWNFVGVSVDRTANTVTFHVNGVTEPAQTLLPAGSFNSPVDLLVGGTFAPPNTPYGELALDEIELFNRALTQADLTAIWQANSAGKCKPPPCTNSVVSIFCPPNTNVQTCATGAVVFFPPAIASTSCGVITNLVAVPPSGSFFPVGTNTVTCTAWDSLGNSNSCTFLVIVAGDKTPPNCPPASLSVTGCPPLMPDFSTNSLITDNCTPPGQIIVTQNIPPGTPITASPTFVILTICDLAGNCRVCDIPITPVLTPNCCQPTPVLRLFSGATNNVPGVLPGGALDSHFLTGAPLFTTANPYVPFIVSGWWVPNSAASKWVSPSANYVNLPGGVYFYTNRFFLCSTNQASVSGRWTADDSGRIFLNGAPTANVLPASWAFTNWHPVSITSGFVPGWNTLVFAVTNGGYSPTGLRTEIRGIACCSTCVAISCPPDVVTTTCAKGENVNFPLPTATSACGNIVSITASPPSGSFFPVGTNVVTCTAVDSQGNAATCSFNVVVLKIGKPVIVKCPPNQIRYTCGTSAVVHFTPWASGNVGPIVSVPPSGSSFPLGTNVVTCIATNACGDVATCSFTIVVKPYPLGAPSLTYQAGLPDNFALPSDPASTNACLVAAVSGFPFWKNFDTVAINRLFGHRFTGLPGNIVQAQLIVRMKPENDGVGVGVGSDNDGLFIGLTNCVPGNWAFIASIKALPGAGGNWFPGHPPTTFTNTLPPAAIAHMNTSGLLDVMVHDDTTVDFMTLRLWLCPPPIHPNGGLPHWTKSGFNPPSEITVIPQPELPDFGPIGPGAAISVVPPGGDPATPNGVEIGVGGGQAFSFTTVLPADAPEGAEIVVSVPTPDGTNAPLLSFVKAGCKPRCHWDIKVLKKFFDDGGPACRVSAVNSNGQLLDSFFATSEEAEAEPLLSLAPEEGVSQFPVSLLIDAATREITFTYPGQAARRLCNGLPCPRGWDGTIKGRIDAARRKGWDGVVKCPCYDDSSARIVFTPLGGPGGGTGQLPPKIEIASSGLNELIIAGERLYAMGGEIVPVPESPVAFMGTAEGNGLVLAADEDFGGLTLDLGRSLRFDLGLHQVEPGDTGIHEAYFRFNGPRWPPGTTTNRPPPPVFDLRLAQTASGTESSVDYSPLGATNVLVKLYSNGVWIAYGEVNGPIIFAEDPLPLGRWPERMGLMGTNCVVRLICSEFFDIMGFRADEVEIIPGLPPGTPVFDYASGLTTLASGGSSLLLYDLQRVPACTPANLSISPSPGGTVLSWPGDGYRLLGAESVGGPWVDLGGTSPVVLTPEAPQRFFRIVCE